jgi:kinesin family member C2/C3
MYPVAAGYNVCIFAYGQTGSGKTHTMAGSDTDSLADRGINYRALDDLFAINAQCAGEVTHSCLAHTFQLVLLQG